MVSEVPEETRTRRSWIASGPIPLHFNSPEGKLSLTQSAEWSGYQLLGIATWPQLPGEPARLPLPPALVVRSLSAHCPSGRPSLLSLPCTAFSDYASGSFGPSSASVPDDPSPRVPPPPPSPGAGATSSVSGVAGF